MGKLIAGVVAGWVTALLALWVAAPHLMIRTSESPYSVEETVSRIEAAATAKGWVVAGVKPLDQSIRVNGGPSIPPLRLVELCQASHAGALLDDDSQKKLSVMMPCTVSVYEDSEGGVHVAAMNAGLLGRAFGGEVAKVMGGDVAHDQAEIIGTALARD